MYTSSKMDITVKNEDELFKVGSRLGAAFKGGEVIELVGDVGAGKTTLTKAIAIGMEIEEAITSPSYTLSQVYEAPSGLKLAHYDFYRLDDPGILANELAEAQQDDTTVTVIEWADIVSGVLPADHLRIRIVPLTETERRLTFSAAGSKSKSIVEKLR